MNPTNWNQIRLNEIIRTYTNSKVANKIWIFYSLCRRRRRRIVVVASTASGNTMRQFSRTHTYRHEYETEDNTTKQNEKYLNKVEKKKAEAKKNHIPLFWKPYTISECRAVYSATFFSFVLFIFCSHFAHYFCYLDWTISLRGERMRGENIIAIA